MKKVLFFLCVLGGLKSYSGQTLKLLSYNTGLAHTFVPLAKARLPEIINALKSVDSELICMQEVWKSRDRKKIIKGLREEFPHFYYTPIKQTRSHRRPTCKIGEIFGEGKFISCMRNKCGGLSGDEFTACIINICGGALNELKDKNPQCAQSIMAQVGRNPVLGILTVINPVKRAGLFTYKGGNGLLILSKSELTKARTMDMSDISTLVRRQVLFGEIEKAGTKHSVFCTHLTANLSSIPYTGFFSNWEKENKAQIDRLLADASRYDNPTYLMGDFNCALKDKSNDLGGTFTKSCQAVIDSGYWSPLLSDSPKCSYCTDNLLVKDGNDSKEREDILIDHIFVKNIRPLSSKVILKQHVTVKKSRKETVETNLSDHYGISVEVGAD